MANRTLDKVPGLDYFDEDPTKLRAASVRITSYFLVDVVVGEGDEQEIETLRTSITKIGNGTHIANSKVITAGSLVMLSPAVTSAVYAPGEVIPEHGQRRIRNTLIAASQIIVEFIGVDNIYSFTKVASLAYYDGRDNIAILDIDDGGINLGTGTINEVRTIIEQGPYCEREQRINYPTHTFVDVIRSRAEVQCDVVRSGEQVWILGATVNTNAGRLRLEDDFKVITGTVSGNNNYYEQSGWVLHESIIVDVGMNNVTVGSGIVNRCGYLVGIVGASLTNCFPLATPSIDLEDRLSLQAYCACQIIGPNQYCIARAVNDFFYTASLTGNDCCSERVVSYCGCGPGQSYYFARHGYLGMAFESSDGTDYFTTTDFTSGGGPNQGRPLYNLFAPSIDPGNQISRSVQGVTVLGLAGINPNADSGVQNGYWYVPGGNSSTAFPGGSDAVPPMVDSSAAPNPFFNNGIYPIELGLFPVGPSPLLCDEGFLPGTLVMLAGSANSKCYKVGNHPCQTSLQRIMSDLLPGHRFSLYYIRGGNSLFPDGSFDTSTPIEISVCLAETPLVMNYPYYSFPQEYIVGKNGTPLYLLPAGQYTGSLVPQRSDPDAAIFHPAI